MIMPEIKPSFNHNQIWDFGDNADKTIHETTKQYQNLVGWQDNHSWCFIRLITSEYKTSATLPVGLRGANTITHFEALSSSSFESLLFIPLFKGDSPRASLEQVAIWLQMSASESYYSWYSSINIKTSFNLLLIIQVDDDHAQKLLRMQMKKKILQFA
jgi:hypothetical protein